MILTPRKPPPQEPVSHLRGADLVTPLLLLLPRVPGNPQGGSLGNLLIHPNHRHSDHHLLQRLVDACSSSNSRWRVGGRATRGSDSVWAVLTGEVFIIMIVMVVNIKIFLTGEVSFIMILTGEVIIINNQDGC